MAAGYRNRSQEKKIDKINRKPACDNGSKIIAGFHLGFKVWGGEGLRTPQNVWPLPHLLTTPPITC